LKSHQIYLYQHLNRYLVSHEEGQNTEGVQHVKGNFLG